MNLYTKSLLFLAATVACSYGVIYDQVSQYTYDYIVIGGVSNDKPFLSEDGSVIIVRWWFWKHIPLQTV